MGQRRGEVSACFRGRGRDDRGVVGRLVDIDQQRDEGSGGGLADGAVPAQQPIPGQFIERIAGQVHREDHQDGEPRGRFPRTCTAGSAR